MEFEDLVRVVGDEPVFETGLLLAGDVDPRSVQRQLSRWTKAGKLQQLRRGLYALAPPFQKVAPQPFLVANRLVRASYVSCQSALAFHALIPEHVAVTISVTTQRPGRWDTPLGSFEFRHIQPALFTGYRLERLDGQSAFVAEPEKALLDLVYLTPGADTPAYLQELRLQNLEQLDLDRLDSRARASGSRKLVRAAAEITALARDELQSYRRI